MTINTNTSLISWRRAFTLVEGLVALAIFSVLLTVFWQLYRGARVVENYYQPGLGAQQDVSLAMNRMVEEIREGVEIFHPVPAAPAVGDVETRAAEGDGIGFTNVRGEPIIYYLADAETDAMSGKIKPRTLMRGNLATKQKERIALGVKRFKILVPPHRIGKKLARANVELSVLKGQDDDPNKLDRFDLITSIFLRNVNKDLSE